MHHPVDERDEQEEPGALRVREQPAEPEDDAALVLARDLDGREEEQDGENENDGEHDQAGGHIHQAGSSPVGVDSGSYDEPEVLLDSLDADMLAGDELLTVLAARAPELAVDLHEAVPPHDASFPTMPCTPTATGCRADPERSASSRSRGGARG